MWQHAIYLSVICALTSIGVTARNGKPDVQLDRTRDVNEDVAAINTLIDTWDQTEDDYDMDGQAELMAEDRVFIGPAGYGRTTDQAGLMESQKVNLEVARKEIPGMRWFSDSRDRLIRFHGDGTVAVASFYWVRRVILPADTPPEKAKLFPQPDAESCTLVLEKRDGDWIIVHTHMSFLFPVNPVHYQYTAGAR